LGIKETKEEEPKGKEIKTETRRRQVCGDSDANDFDSFG